MLWTVWLQQHKSNTVFLLKYSWFKMLCSFFLYSKTQLCVHVWILFHILFHYDLPQDIEYRSLCYTVGPYCLPLLIPHSQSFPPLPPSPWHLQVCSLYLWNKNRLTDIEQNNKRGLIRQPGWDLGVLKSSFLLPRKSRAGSREGIYTTMY